MIKLGDRNAVVFNKIAIKKAVTNYDDDDFKTTDEEWLKILDDLKKVQQGEPLLTVEGRELLKKKKRAAKIKRHPTLSIRVQFPNLYVLQGEFKPTETIGDVTKFVRGYLVNPDITFNLCEWIFCAIS